MKLPYRIKFMSLIMKFTVLKPKCFFMIPGRLKSA